MSVSPGGMAVTITKTGKVRNTNYVYGSGRTSSKSRRCGECEGCMRDDCWHCVACQVRSLKLGLSQGYSIWILGCAQITQTSTTFPKPKKDSNIIFLINYTEFKTNWIILTAASLVSWRSTSLADTALNGTSIVAAQNLFWLLVGSTPALESWDRVLFNATWVAKWQRGLYDCQLCTQLLVTQSTQIRIFAAVRIFRKKSHLIADNSIDIMTGISSLGKDVHDCVICVCHEEKKWS